LLSEQLETPLSAMATARSVIRIVSPTSAGPLKRLVGSVDFKGKGTKHELEGVDPVVLCDYAVIQGVGKPPFGLHPHYGLIAVTSVFEGAFNDADNLNPPDGHLNSAGGVYMVSAGRGVCHQETTALEGRTVAVQTIFKIPDDKKDFLPELIKVKAEDIPVLDVAGGRVSLLVGRLGEIESPAKVKSLPRVVMLMVKSGGGTIMELPLDTDLEHGFVFVVSGKCRLGNKEGWCEAGNELCIFGGGSTLKVEIGEEGFEALVVAGKPLNEPWVKLLGNNGFIITATEEEAEKVMDVVQKTGNEFSFQKL